MFGSTLFNCKDCNDRYVGCHAKCSDYNASKIIEYIYDTDFRNNLKKNDIYWGYKISNLHKRRK